MESGNAPEGAFMRLEHAIQSMTSSSKKEELQTCIGFESDMQRVLRKEKEGK